MPKATLEFILPEESMDYMLHYHGPKYAKTLRAAINTIDHLMERDPGNKALVILKTNIISFLGDMEIEPPPQI